MIETLRQRLAKLMDRVDAMALRERGLIFVAVLIVVYVVAVNGVFEPMRAEQARLNSQLKSKHDQIAALEKQIQAFRGGRLDDPDAAKRARLAALQEQMKSLDATLARTTANLVTPKEMARLVEQVLANVRGLQVVKVESLRPAPLAEPAAAKPGETKPATATPGPEARIYKHGLRIELKGTYLDMLNSLQALERLPWKVFWGQVTLETETHPVSKLTLVIYTLSAGEGWIAM